jgi:ribulose kinase
LEHAAPCRIILPRENEAVLLGSAMLGAVAGGIFTDLGVTMAAMSDAGTVITHAAHTQAYNARRYVAFHRLFSDK